MAKLAIRGHKERGKEVIALLEMLGGNNKYHINITECNFLYTIGEGDDAIIATYPNSNISQIFTLEQFLEKFPYKVGDKVQHKGATSCGSIYEVKKMRWEEDTVKYTVHLFGCNYKSSTLPSEYLQLYKEETMEGKKLNSNASFLDCSLVDKIELVLGDTHEVVVEDGKTFVVRKKPQYPKTYEKCCEAVNASPYVALVYDKFDGETYSYDIDNLQHYENIRELLICRDAYWKIAGEQMGLGKSWKPDWENGLNKCCLTVCENRIIKSSLASANAILAFPTKEMRDAFYENFKELIQQCKELL